MNSLQFSFRVMKGNSLGLLPHNWGIEVDIWKDKAKAIFLPHNCIFFYVFETHDKFRANPIIYSGKDNLHLIISLIIWVRKAQLIPISHAKVDQLSLTP